MSKVKSTKYLKYCIYLIVVFWQTNMMLLSLMDLSVWGNLFLISQLVATASMAILGIKALREEEISL